MGSIVYMPLQDEGTNVWRPVAADALGDQRYRVTARAPDDEAWAFVSGSVVIVDDQQRIISEAGE
jgi:hypothetical protein